MLQMAVAYPVILRNVVRYLLSKKNTMLATMILVAHTSFAGASESAEAAPSIWDGDIATSIFAILLFLMMLLVLGKYAWGPILSGLNGREEYIRQQIKDSERMKSDADKSLRRYEARLAKAQERADEIIDNARLESEKISKRITDQAQEKATEILSQSSKAIINAKEQAVRDLHGYTAELAVELASKILGRSINSEDHSKLIKNTIDQIGKE